MYPKSRYSYYLLNLPPPRPPYLFIEEGFGEKMQFAAMGLELFWLSFCLVFPMPFTHHLSFFPGPYLLSGITAVQWELDGGL